MNSNSLKLPFVSVIVPVRNEEKFIGKCLESIINQDYPKENLEVLVVDGVSTDKTREIIEKFKIQNSKFKIRLIDNPQKFTPFGLNIGIKNSQGEVVIRMDAHAGYEKEYISMCVQHLLESGADNVGGAVKTLPAKETAVARAIAISLSHPFGAASSFRLGSKESVETDTVFGGCYKREIFDRIGLFNEKLLRSQDLELNLRLKKSGGRILLFPDIIVSYYPQSSFLNFLKHNFADGVWSIYPLKFIKTKFKLRHYIPLIFVLTLPLSIWPYMPLSLFFSLQVALREKDFRFFFLMPLAFACRHFGYGLGSIFGLVKILLS